MTENDYVIHMLIDDLNANTDQLEHYGIKGMKWGIRRTPEQLGYKKSAPKGSYSELDSKQKKSLVSEFKKGAFKRRKSSEFESIFKSHIFQFDSISEQLLQKMQKYKEYSDLSIKFSRKQKAARSSDDYEKYDKMVRHYENKKDSHWSKVYKVADDISKNILGDISNTKISFIGDQFGRDVRRKDTLGSLLQWSMFKRAYDFANNVEEDEVNAWRE